MVQQTRSLWGRIIIVAIVSALFLMSCRQDNIQAVPVAAKGVLDLSGWNFAGDDIVKLQGEWAFFREEFISPNSPVTVKQQQNEALFLTVPGYWDEKTDGIGSFGYGSYQLLVLLPEEVLARAISAGIMQSASEVFVNGRPLSKAGSVGANKEESILEYKVTVGGVTGTENSDLMEIIVQVLNFHSIDGGMGQVMRLGFEGRIHHRYHTLVAFNFFSYELLL